MSPVASAAMPSRGQAGQGGGRSSSEFASRDDLTTKLDSLTLSRKEGLKALVNAPRRQPPEALSVRQLRLLGEGAKAEYDRGRRIWHANLGPIKTPQLLELHEDLWDIVDSNQQEGDKAKGAIAIDAFPGLGKTTAALAFVRQFYRREIEEEGAYTDAGHERIPVCRVGLTDNTGMKDFNRALLEFFGHPGRFSGTTTQFINRALDCVLSCDVRVLVVDELHFLRWKTPRGAEVSNHFKHIANEFPVTLLLIGVGLERKGLFSEGGPYQDAVLAQTARRTTRLGLEPFEVNTPAGREAWRQMLLALEQRVVLAGKRPGMIADELSDYLFARSTGHIGSLMTLINRGCQRTIRTGTERLTIEVMDKVKNDSGAEAARRELEAALASGRLTTRNR